MKKTIFSSLIAALLITGLSVLTSSCKKDPLVTPPSELIVGTWDATSIISDEEEVLVPGSGYTLVMKFDGWEAQHGSKFTWTFAHLDEAFEVRTGTYAFSSDGKTLTLRDSATNDSTEMDVQILNDKKIKFGDYFQTIEATKR